MLLLLVILKDKLELNLVRFEMPESVTRPNRLPIKSQIVPLYTVEHRDKLPESMVAFKLSCELPYFS